jgi:hypothetical protein
MVNDLGWSTIPLVTVIAFTFMGIEGIADEIEMPFGQSLPKAWPPVFLIHPIQERTCVIFLSVCAFT